MGGLYNPGLEAVVALAPDLVVLVPSAEQRDFRARLAALEIPCLELNPIRFDEVLGAIEQLGARVGRDAAAAARVREIRRVRSGVEDATRELPRVRTLLVLQRDPPFVVGRGSFVDEMMRAAGAENVAAEFAEPYPRVTREWIIDAAPEVILDSSDSPGDALRVLVPVAVAAGGEAGAGDLSLHGRRHATRALPGPRAARHRSGGPRPGGGDPSSGVRFVKVLTRRRMATVLVGLGALLVLAVALGLVARTERALHR